MKYLEFYHSGVSEEEYLKILARSNQLSDKAEHYRHENWGNSHIWHDIIKDDIDLVDFFRKEGYWAEKKEINSAYPWPQENTISQEDLADFLPLLRSVQTRIKNKKLNGSFRSFMGYSTCRCCGIKNGTQEYCFQGWTWPIGFEHYLVEHKVAPSPSFVLFIRALNNKI